MHFVSGHKRPAGRGSVLDGAVERGGCKDERVCDGRGGVIQKERESTPDNERMPPYPIRVCRRQLMRLLYI